MENNSEDFKDFDDIPDKIELDSDISAIDEDAVEKALKNIASQMMNESSEFDNPNLNNSNEESTEDTSEQENTDSSQDINASTDVEEVEKSLENENLNTDDIDPEQTEYLELKETSQEKTPIDADELSQWEEYNSSNDVVKKYIIYISKDFIPYIDNLSTDARSAYINDAIQLKLDIQNENKKRENKRNAVIHFILAIFIIIALTPIGLIFANKAIMATFENYKYSQDNFEKLYKHRFEKDKAFMQSLQYNQEYKKKIKKNSN